MALPKEVKREIVAQFGKNEKDTGALEVQIALLTKKIERLSEHFKNFHKDHNSHRGLLIMVGHRRQLLKHLHKESEERYMSCIKALGLRK